MAKRFRKKAILISKKMRTLAPDIADAKIIV
jgi:hypothetical protein